MNTNRSRSAHNSGSSNEMAHIPVICFFWDIENCPIPRDKSVFDVAAMLRNKFVVNRKEEEFYCVCDSTKELKETVDEMVNAQITLVHVPCQHKNAADDKLRSLIRKFSDKNSAGDVVVLISGDVNFVAELHQVRYTHHQYVIIIHPSKVNPAFLVTANEYYSFEDLLNSVPARSGVKDKNNHLNNLIKITGLPPHAPWPAIYTRLKQLVANTGGRIDNYREKNNTGVIVQFPNPEATIRAYARLQNEDVCGAKISAEYHEESEHAQNARRLNGVHPSASVPNIKQTLPSYFCNPPTMPGHQQIGPNVVQAQGHYYMPGFPTWYHQPHGHSASFSGSYPQSAPIPAPQPVVAQPALHPSYSFPVQIAAAAAPSASFVPKAKKQQQAAQGNSAPKADSYFSRHAPVEATLSRDKLKTSSSQQKMNGATDPFKDLAERAAAWRKKPAAARTLCVSNIDATVDGKVATGTLLSKLKESFIPTVPSIKIDIAGDGTLSCTLEFPDDVDVNLVSSVLSPIVFNKRPVKVSAKSNPPSLVALKLAVIEVYKQREALDLPMFELFNLFNAMYDKDLTMDNLRQMTEILVDHGKTTPRIYRLKGEAVTWANKLDDKIKRQNVLELGYCTKHCPKILELVESKKVYRPLMYVKTSLKALDKALSEVLRRHDGAVKLISIVACLEDVNFKLKEDVNNGVYLEHLLRSIPGIALVADEMEPRQLMAVKVDGNATVKGAELSELEENLWNLLVSAPRSAMSVYELITKYHEEYGADCPVRVGNPEEIEKSLRMISVDFEILGNDANRLITLTHQAQKRRFGHDFNRIKASRPKAVLTQKSFPVIYEEIFKKKFCLADFGVSDFLDLCDLPVGEDALDGKKHLAKENIPPVPVKPLLTAESFAQESIRVLCSIAGYQQEHVAFANAYRKMIGVDLKLSKYGFSKLVDLFDACSKDLEVVPDGSARHVSLKRARRLEHLESVLKMFRDSGKVTAFLPEFISFFDETVTAHPFKVEEYGVTDPMELFGRFPHLLTVEKAGKKKKVKLQFIMQQDDTSPGSGASSFSEGSGVLEERPVEVEQVSPGAPVVRANDSGLDSEKETNAKPQISKRLAVKFY